MRSILRWFGYVPQADLDALQLRLAEAEAYQWFCTQHGIVPDGYGIVLKVGFDQMNNDRSGNWEVPMEKVERKIELDAYIRRRKAALAAPEAVPVG